MLTDIFAARYTSVPLWETFQESDRRFLVQAFRIVEEQLYPYYLETKVSEYSKAKWELIHARLSTELGVKELSPRYRHTGNVWSSGFREWNTVCEGFVCAAFDGSLSADQFMKERMSFIEIAFRERETQVQQANKALPGEVAKLNARQRAKGVSPPFQKTLSETATEEMTRSFRFAVEELNTRFRQAAYKLHYHNGFIQISADDVVAKQIETPFWGLVAPPEWQNVDTDMKEALDLRDSGGRDPAFYAAKALESTIKIVSAEKGWTHGGEKGAHAFIDNLASKKAKFIDGWESDQLKYFFTNIRNPLGHGPGGEPMPVLNPQQTDWAIEFCMSWVKSLIHRM